MIRRPPRSTHCISSAASDVYKRQLYRKTGRIDDAKREVELYKKFKEMKEKLRTLYKELQVQPKEIRADEPDEKNERDEQ